MIGFTEMNGEITFSVRVLPRASKSEIVGEHDGALKIKLTSPPVDGAANNELKRLLAKRFGLAKTAVVIVGGAGSKDKRIRMSGISKQDFLNAVSG